MTETPLIVLLGNDDDDSDHRIVFSEIERLGGRPLRVHPDELVIEVTPESTRFFVGGEELAIDLMMGWVYEDYLILGMNQLETARLAGVPVVNSAMTLMRGQSKYLNSALLNGAKVPHLPVMWGRDEDTLATWTNERGYPLVTKPLMLSCGRDLHLLTDEAAVRAHVRELGPGPDTYYVQPYVPARHQDIRVLCVNYQAVAAIERTAPDGSWISTADGFTRRRLELTPDIAEIGERAAEVMDALWAGVDVARDERTGELVVYEVNTCPTCAEALHALGGDPVPLTELASFLVAAGRDFEDARRNWRPSATY